MRGPLPLLLVATTAAVSAVSVLQPTAANTTGRQPTMEDACTYRVEARPPERTIAMPDDRGGPSTNVRMIVPLALVVAVIDCTGIPARPGLPSSPTPDTTICPTCRETASPSSAPTPTPVVPISIPPASVIPCPALPPARCNVPDVTIAPQLPTYPGDPAAFVDTPTPGAVVTGKVVVAGWAIDRNAQTSAGIREVAIYLDGPVGSGTPLGTAVLGDPRPDIGTLFGPVRKDSGWHLEWDATLLSGGAHTLYVVVTSAVTGQVTTIARNVTK